MERMNLLGRGMSWRGREYRLWFRTRASARVFCVIFIIFVYLFWPRRGGKSKKD